MIRHRLGLLPIWMTLAGLSAPAAAQVAAPQAAPTAAAEPMIAGDGYLVKVRRGDAEQRLVGDLVKANDRWIVLHTRTLGGEASAPAAPKNALGQGKVIKNAARKTIDELLWIPRDAAVIQRHHPRASRLPSVQIQDDSPPRQNPCTVELADGYQVARREGEFLGWAGSELALAQTPDQPPQRIAYGLILCLRFRQSR
jgi:hypothetical protein